MAAPIEPEKYEVLETIGIISKMCKDVIAKLIDDDPRAGIIWYYQKSPESVGWSRSLPPTGSQRQQLLTLILLRYYAAKKFNTSKCLRKSENNFMLSFLYSTP